MTYKKCLLYFKNDDANIRILIPKILDWLEKRKIDAEILDSASSDLNSLPHEALIICLGGDGTLLGAGRMAAGAKHHIMGINCGHVGHLCAATPENWENALAHVLNAEEAVFYIGLKWRLMKDDEVLEAGVAINDLVVSRGSLTRMISLDLKINGAVCGRARGDGLICYTPLGSTGYNLSAGGPLLAPELKNIGITPICPFTFSFPPMVAPENSIIEISADANSRPVYATIDGQEGFEMEKGRRLQIEALQEAVCLPGLFKEHPAWPRRDAP